MPIDPKDWENLPSTNTPISAEALQDLEVRTTGYADTLVSDHEADTNPHPLYALATDIGTLEAAVSVRDHGAQGNGSTDDTDAFNDAIAEAVTSGLPVFVPAGQYVVPSLVIDDDDLAIVGVGDRSWIQTATGLHLGPSTGSGVTSRVTLRDLKVTRSSTAFGFAIAVRQTNRATVERVTVDSQYGGIVIGHSDYPVTPVNTKVKDCDVTAVQNAIWSNGSLTDNVDETNTQIVGNKVLQHGVAEPGIEIWLGGSLVAFNHIKSSIYQGGGGGITAGGYGKRDIRIIGNHIEGFSLGIEIGNIEQGVAEGNLIRACGIGLAMTGSQNETDVNLTGNTVIVSDEYVGTLTPLRGIHIQGMQAATLTGNVVRYETTLPYTDTNSRKHRGIEVSTNMRRVTITGGAFINIDRALNMGNTSGDVQVSGVTFDNVRIASHQTGGNPIETFTGCIFHNHGAALINRIARFRGCRFNNESDFTFVNVPPAQGLTANANTVIELSGCTFNNVTSTCMRPDASMAIIGAGYTRPKIEYADSEVRAGWTETTWSAVDAVFTAAGEAVPHNRAIYVTSTNQRYVKTEWGVLTRGTAAPASGTWARGDRVYSTTPSASGTEGWICTTAGTPGTWKTFGTIGA